MAEDDTQQNPFSRPGFIIGAIVVAALIIAAIFLTVLNLNRGDEAASPPPGPASPAATPTPTPDASEAANGASACGLDGEVLTGTVTTAPSAEWAYVRTVAYPTSSTFGPAASSPEGVPTCFQHSPTGALFAAATALAIPAEPTLVRPWLENGLSSGPYRESLLSDAENTSDSSGIRLQLVGFRVLAYDGETARIDLAVRGSTQGTTITASTVYDLIWEDGDWKINANVANPFDFATIPDTSGYIAWGQ
ncbi:hypothetical protein ABXJ56_15625 [Microbacterium chocolatum]|uniref:hypothetical protein n=1 Tax=Microbacterium aurantiacum TaxID=162393 RepID=UPI00338F20A1